MKIKKKLKKNFEMGQRRTFSRHWGRVGAYFEFLKLGILNFSKCTFYAFLSVRFWD